MSKEALHQHLVVLRAKVDDHFDAAVARSPGQMQCQAGCSECCQAGFGVFGVEAEPMRLALGRLEVTLRDRIRAQGRDEGLSHCALLVDGRCSVYEARPLICRSMGAPVRVDDRTDVCRLNFTGRAAPPESVLRLEALNQPLAVMAEMWDGGSRVSLADLAAETE